MQRWEVCVIKLVKNKRGAFKSDTYKYVAYAFSPQGLRSIAESPEWEGKSEGEFESLVARLGIEGWEPMPVNSGSFTAYGGQLEVTWYFKRATSANMG